MAGSVEKIAMSSKDADAAVPPSLPAFIQPMLAKPGEAFDSEQHLFEVKWDGTRGLAFVDAHGRYRLLNRRRIDMAWRYPELACLGELPAGTVLDGEIVVLLADGRPDFESLQSREQARTPQRAQWLAKVKPATFVAFDQLYDAFDSVMARPCRERRDLLRQTIVAMPAGERIIMSEGVTGSGRAYFERVCAMGLEGVVAKRLDSPYLPGKRSDAWIKIKRQELHCCVVIGFVPGETASGSEARDFSSLVIAAQIDGELRCVGRVGTGFNEPLRERINTYLWSHLRPSPVIAFAERGARWVESGLYCTVRCMERTSTGQLRAPALVELLDEPVAGAPADAKPLRKRRSARSKARSK
jgi:bifunctional non-homologous end joining protein LigD